MCCCACGSPQSRHASYDKENTLSMEAEAARQTCKMMSKYLNHENEGGAIVPNLKQPLTREQIVEMYRSPISQKGENPALLRTKINLDIGGTCRFGMTEGQPRDPPDNWKNTEFVPHLTLRNLWITGAMCGFCLDVNDLQVHDAPPKCCSF